MKQDQYVASGSQDNQSLTYQICQPTTLIEVFDFQAKHVNQSIYINVTRRCPAVMVCPIAFKPSTHNLKPLL